MVGASATVDVIVGSMICALMVTGEDAKEGNEIKNEDGEAEDAEWYGLLIPSGISVSASGNVLVSDYGKHVVFDF
jgi:hypothetical protein